MKLITVIHHPEVQLLTYISGGTLFEVRQRIAASRTSTCRALSLAFSLTTALTHAAQFTAHLH
jgi:hypothetical protein